MEKVLLGFILSGVASLGFAEQPVANNETSIEKFKEEVCESNLRMAKLIMTARQTGTPIDKTLELVIHQDDKDNFFNKINKNLVIDAYSRPLFSTPKYQQEEVNEFGAKHYILCMKETGLF